jgi:hypothetical protein
MANFRLIFEWVFKRQRPPETIPDRFEISVDTSWTSPIDSRLHAAAPFMVATENVSPLFTTTTKQASPLHITTSATPPLNTRFTDG